MVGCCVPKCGKNSSTPTTDERFPEGGRKITYHQFPANAIRAEWVRILHDGGRPDEWKPDSNTKICSLHFKLEDLKCTKGTQTIIKGATPCVPKTDYKKPMRRNKVQTKEAYEKLVQETVITEEINKYDSGMNAPGTSSADSYSPIDGVLTEQEELASPTIKRKKIVMLPNTMDECSQSNKVVTMADNHTFDVPIGASYEDPCLSTYCELMDLLKKFNQQMSLHHPSKYPAVQKLLTEASNIFTPEELEQQEKLEYTTLTSDPVMTTGVVDNLTTEMQTFGTNDDASDYIPEQELAELLDYPLDCLFTPSAISMIQY